MSVHTEEKLLVAVARVTSLGSMGLALARKARLMKMKMKMELTICILLVVGGLKEVWRLSALDLLQLFLFKECEGGER